MENEDSKSKNMQEKIRQIKSAFNGKPEGKLIPQPLGFKMQSPTNLILDSEISKLTINPSFINKARVRLAKSLDTLIQYLNGVSDESEFVKVNKKDLKILISFIEQEVNILVFTAQENNPSFSDISDQIPESRELFPGIEEG